MINVSKGFNLSTTGANTSLYPIVIIDSSIYISSHEIVLNNTNFEPILLNIPTITERLNLESKKQTISNVILQVSNLPVLPLGARFSDSGDLKNKEVEIYYCSNTTTTFNPDDDNSAVLVYRGYIAETKMDSKLVVLTVEDTIYKELKETLPLKRHNVGDKAIRDDDRNKPLPYVFGTVDKSPAYLLDALKEDDSLSSDNIGKVLVADAEDVLDNSNNILTKHDTGEYNAADTTETGISTIYALKDSVYLSLNLYDPYVGLPKVENEDGEMVTQNFSEWKFDQSIHNWNWVKDIYADLYQYIDQYKQRGYYFRNQSVLTELRGEIIKRGFVPVSYINKPRAVEGVLMPDDGSGVADGSVESDETTGHINPITINNSGVVDNPTPEGFANILNENGYLSLEGHAEVGMYNDHSSNRKYIRRPCSLAYKITMDNMPSFPCKTFAIINIAEPTGNRMKIINKDGDSEFTWGNRTAIWCIWQDNFSDDPPESYIGGGNTGLQLTGRIYTDLNFKRVFCKNLGQYSIGWSASPDSSVHRLLNNVQSEAHGNGYQTMVDNLNAGLNKMMSGSGENYFDNTDIDGFALHKKMIGEGLDFNTPYMGGMSFNQSDSYNTLYVGFPYHILSSSDMGGTNIDAFASGLSDGYWYGNLDDSISHASIGSEEEPVKIDLYNFQLLHQGFLENWDEHDYYIKAVGRNSDLPRSSKHIKSIVTDILGLDVGYATNNEVLEQNENSFLDLSFTLFEEEGAKDIIGNMLKSTKSFFKIDNENNISFPTIASTYNNVNEYSPNKVFYQADILSYKFSKTKKVYNKFKVKYNYDYGLDNFLDQTDIADAEQLIPNYDPAYYNITEDKVLEFESKVIRDKSSAYTLAQYLMYLHSNEHNIANITVPIGKGISLESGDVIAFNEELDNMTLYGMKYAYKDFSNAQYTEQYKVNGQFAYPLFFITKISKDTSKATIEAVQLHHLHFQSLEWNDSAYINGVWETVYIRGCTLQYALNYDPLATISDNSCVFPDQDDNAPIIDLQFTINGSVEQTGYEAINEDNIVINIQNFSYDPDDLEGTGYDSIYQIPNFIASQTANMQFNHSLEVWDGITVIFSQSNLEQENLGDTWNGAYGLAPLPTIRITKNVDSIQYDEVAREWVIPAATDRILSYNFTCNATLIGGTENINSVPYYFSLQAQLDDGYIPNGDVNFDNILNVLDIVKMINYITGEEDLTDEQIGVGDMNNDGVLNVLDVVIVINIIIST